MKRRTRPPPTTSASSTSTSGSTCARWASMSAWTLLTFVTSFMKKAGSSPASRWPHGREKLCPEGSSAKRHHARAGRVLAGPARVDRCGRQRLARPAHGGRLSRFTRPVAVDPVVPALGIHGGGERERLARLGSPAELHQRAAEAEQ